MDVRNSCFLKSLPILKPTNTSWKLYTTQDYVALCKLKVLKEPHTGQGGAKSAAWI